MVCVSKLMTVYDSTCEPHYTAAGCNAYHEEDTEASLHASAAAVDTNVGASTAHRLKDSRAVRVLLQTEVCI